jgi:hypothetical protein
MTAKMSLYHGVSPVPQYAATCLELLDWITDGDLKLWHGATLREQVQRVRFAQQDGDQRAKEEAKKGLPGVTWAGQFRSRKGDLLTEFTGMVVLDFDHLEDPAASKRALRDVSFISFVSPSGDGLKAILMFPGLQPEHYGAAWRYGAGLAEQALASAEIDGKADRSGKDISRLCFLSYDPALLRNDDAYHYLPDDYPKDEPKEQRTKLHENGEKIREGRHQLIVREAGLLVAKLPDYDIDSLLPLLQAFVDRNLDMTGRAEQPTELRDALEHAKRRHEGGRDLAGEIEGAAIVAGLLAKPEPEPLPELSPDLPADLLTGWGKWMDKACEEIEECSIYSQPALALAASFASFGAVFGRMARSCLKNHTNVYTVGLAQTGAGKEAARRYWKEALYAGAGTAPGLLHPEEFASGPGVTTAVSERLSGICYNDEFGLFLRSIGGPNAPAHLLDIRTRLIKLYSLAGSIDLGRARADGKATAETVLVSPCLCMYGTGNEVDFWAGMQGASVTNGFLPRLMVFESSKYADPKNATMDGPSEGMIAHIRAWWEARGSVLARDLPDPVVVPFSDDAKAYLSDWETRHLQQMRSGLADQEMRKELKSRLKENAQKLALIATLAELDTPAAMGQAVISLEITEKAMRLLEHLSDWILHRAGDAICETADAAQMQRFVQWIRRNGKGRPVARRDVMRALHLRARECEDIVVSLLQQGVLEQLDGESAGDGPGAKLLRLVRR